MYFSDIMVTVTCDNILECGEGLDICEMAFVPILIAAMTVQVNLVIKLTKATVHLMPKHK